MSLPTQAPEQNGPPRTAPETDMVARLRAVSLEPPDVLSARLRAALKQCDCWTRSRSGGPGHLRLRLETRISGIADVYSELMACGLDFDRRSHHELTVLCTLELHATGSAPSPRVLDLRLEIFFSDQLRPGELLPWQATA